MITFHIRARKVVQETLCGERCTMFDEKFNSLKVRPTRGFKPCANCVATRRKMRLNDREDRKRSKLALLAERTRETRG